MRRDGRMGLVLALIVPGVASRSAIRPSLTAGYNNCLHDRSSIANRVLGYHVGYKHVRDRPSTCRVQHTQQQTGNRPSVTESMVAAFQSMHKQVESQGKAGLISLVVETVLFWILFLLPTASYLFHQQTGIWVPVRSDSTQWALFTQLFTTCYIFCKMPPIEAARWAWVLAMIPWIGENVLGGTSGAENDGGEGRIVKGPPMNAHLYEQWG